MQMFFLFLSDENVTSIIFIHKVKVKAITLSQRNGDIHPTVFTCTRNIGLSYILLNIIFKSLCVILGKIKAHKLILSAFIVQPRIKWKLTISKWFNDSHFSYFSFPLTLIFYSTLWYTCCCFFFYYFIFA